MSIIGKGYFINSDSAIIHIVAPTGSTIYADHYNTISGNVDKTLESAVGIPRIDRSWVSDYSFKIPPSFYGWWKIRGVNNNTQLIWQEEENLSADSRGININEKIEYLTSCYFYAPILEYDDLEYISISSDDLSLSGLDNDNTHITSIFAPIANNSTLYYSSKFIQKDNSVYGLFNWSGWPPSYQLINSLPGVPFQTDQKVYLDLNPTTGTKTNTNIFMRNNSYFIGRVKDGAYLQDIRGIKQENLDSNSQVIIVGMSTIGLFEAEYINPNNNTIISGYLEPSFINSVQNNEQLLNYYFSAFASVSTDTLSFSAIKLYGLKNSYSAASLVRSNIYIPCQRILGNSIGLYQKKFNNNILMSSDFEYIGNDIGPIRTYKEKQLEIFTQSGF